MDACRSSYIYLQCTYMAVVSGKAIGQVVVLYRCMPLVCTQNCLVHYGTPEQKQPGKEVCLWFVAVYSCCHRSICLGSARFTNDVVLRKPFVYLHSCCYHNAVGHWADQGREGGVRQVGGNYSSQSLLFTLSSKKMEVPTNRCLKPSSQSD